MELAKNRVHSDSICVGCVYSRRINRVVSQAMFARIGPAAKRIGVKPENILQEVRPGDGRYLVPEHTPGTHSAGFVSDNSLHILNALAINVNFVACFNRESFQLFDDAPLRAMMAIEER